MQGSCSDIEKTAGFQFAAVSRIGLSFRLFRRQGYADADRPAEVAHKKACGPIIRISLCQNRFDLYRDILGRPMAGGTERENEKRPHIAEISLSPVFKHLKIVIRQLFFLVEMSELLQFASLISIRYILGVTILQTDPPDMMPGLGIELASHVLC